MKSFAPLSLFRFVVALSGLTGVAGLPAAPFELRDGDRVLFIGDTFFEREVDYGHIETRLTAAFPDRDVIFRNLAWAADTPMGRSRASFDWNKSEDEWLKRVKEQVALVKPTVAFLSCGMTAALDLSETKPEAQAAKLAEFKTDLGRLMDAIDEVSGQKVRFVLLGPVYPEARGWQPPESSLVHRSLSQVETALVELAAARGARFLSLASVTRWTDSQSRTDDWTHLNEQGYRVAAEVVTQTLAGTADESRPPAAFPKRKVDQQSYARLLSAIRKKNELFFHRWRPENWTYLLGFRKHEQGQNAGEILKFDPLVAEWDGRIAKLRDLEHQDKATVAEVQNLLAASSVEHRDPNYKEQPLPTFDVADGFEVTLWAENPMLFKPIQMNWDAKGRLWVVSSRVYPQIRPNQDPADAVIVLEDTDGDGKAEKSTVFADGLLIPTGVVPDNQGGCYVAASHQLLHFADRNKDGKADEKTIVMTSFGTEDTHHNLHTLRWGYDGRLYLNQSIYTHTHIETPHGIRRLNSGGIWRFDPDSWQLEIFTKGGCNPWGHHWDQFGNDFFTDGAGYKGLYHAMEGATYFTYADMRREAESITPGNWPKFASVELIHSPNFPPDWQGDAITCDFRAHRVVRFKLSEAGSTFVGKQMPDLLRSTNVTFRPIDVRLGPDGALYIADWSNPIIQHGEVDFRDPRRDHEHGRIWRVASKTGPVVRKQDLTRLSAAKLLDATLSRNGWDQEQARRMLALKLRHTAPVKSAKLINGWLSKQQNDRALLEALWLHESLGTFDGALVGKVLASANAGIRAAGTRYLANNPGSPDAFNHLAKLIHDDSPRVRVEALRALAGIPTAQSATLALSVLHQPMDPTLDYALWLTINDLAEPWIAAIQSGVWKPEGREQQLEFGLKAIPADQAGRVLGQLLASHQLNRDGAGAWIEIIGAAGTPKELRQLFNQVLSQGFEDPATVRALQALGEASRLRKSRPTGSLSDIGKLLDRPNESVRLESLKLVGEWKELGDYFPKLGELAGAADTSAALRQAAFNTLRQIGGAGATNALIALCADGKDLAVRREAVVALAALNPGDALPRVIEIAKATSDETAALELWRGILKVKVVGQSLRAQLPENSLPEPAARAGMRVAREGGRDDIDLVMAFARAGGLSVDTAALSGEVIKELAVKAASKGDPIRGESVFQRAELNCVTCHAIAGAGGKVGPDLMSIGASAPADYIVEAMLLPSAKIKEGYPSVNIETKDDQFVSGTLARETPEEVVLRTATGAEVKVAKQNIANRQNGTISLMPIGLLDELSERDKLDLIAFLSSLGKPGEFDASKGGVARSWRVYPLTHTDQQNGIGDGIWTKPFSDKLWQPALAQVNGKLTREQLESKARREFWVGILNVFAGAELQTVKAGTVKLNLEARAGELWVDGRKVGGIGESTVELPAGTHRVLVKIDPQLVPESIRLKTSEGTFLNN